MGIYRQILENSDTQAIPEDSDGEHVGNRKALPGYVLMFDRQEESQSDEDERRISEQPTEQLKQDNQRKRTFADYVGVAGEFWGALLNPDMRQGTFKTINVIFKVHKNESQDP